MSYNAGQAKGQAEEKANTMMDKASDAAQSAKETIQEVLNFNYFTFVLCLPTIFSATSLQSQSIVIKI